MMAEFIALANTPLGYIGALVVMYAGIRADIKNIHVNVAMAIHSASRAHERIDTMLEQK